MPHAHLAAALKEQAEKRKATKKTSAVKKAAAEAAKPADSGSESVESD